MNFGQIPNKNTNNTLAPAENLDISEARETLDSKYLCFHRINDNFL